MRLALLSIAIAFVQAAVAHGEKAHVPRPIGYATVKPTPFGIAADPRKANRTFRLEMSDAMRFTPALIQVREGEIVRIVATNKGQMLHEMVLGTMDELKKHAALMKKFPGMEHDEPHMAHVKPGASGEIGWKFTRAGTFYFACLVPGHFEAGMVGKVEVTK
jgi:uncharacterized cupredoxin-like copper-binding protein